MAKTKANKEQEHFEVALGKMIVGMNSLEYNVIVAIAIISKIEMGVAFSMLGGEHLPVLIKMLDSVFPYVMNTRKPETSKDVLKQSSTFVTRLHDVNNKRDYYVHRIWFPTNVPTTVTTKIVRGKKGKTFRWDESEVSLTELESFVQEVTQLGVQLLLFLDVHEFIGPENKYVALGKHSGILFGRHFKLPPSEM